MKRMVTLAIVISLLLASETLFAKEKRGALIVVTKTDGTTIEEELITIKKDSTLLIESSSGVGGSIEISEVKSIKIVKEYKKRS